jgi:hypothetical protein
VFALPFGVRSLTSGGALELSRVRILRHVGFDPPSRKPTSTVAPRALVASWLLRDAEPIHGERVGIHLRPLWPDGDWHQLEGA